MDTQESYEDRMKRWTTILGNKIDLDLDDMYDELEILVAGTNISDDFKSDIVDANIQNVLTRLQYEASTRFSHRQQMRQQ
jgi:hypothetical protein